MTAETAKEVGKDTDVLCPNCHIPITAITTQHQGITWYEFRCTKCCRTTNWQPGLSWAMQAWKQMAKTEPKTPQKVNVVETTRSVLSIARKREKITQKADKMLLELPEHGTFECDAAVSDCICGQRPLLVKRTHQDGWRSIQIVCSDSNCWKSPQIGWGHTNLKKLVKRWNKRMKK